MSDEIKIENIRKSNKGLIISIVAVLVLALIAVLVLFMPKSADAKKISEQLSLGDKYLSELQYEQAEAAYLAVIEIDPKNVDAYLGLAGVYIAQGEYDKAAEVLEDALEELEGENVEEVKGKLDEVEQVRQAAEVTPTIAPTSTPVPTSTSTPTPTPTNTPTPTPTNTPTPNYTFVDINKEMYVKDFVSIYDLPTTEGNHIGNFTKYTTVKVLRQCNETNWFEFEYLGNLAYASSEFFELEKTFPEDLWKNVIGLKDAQVGYLVEFGSYEQDENLENGVERLQWLVLEVYNGKALLLCKYGIESRSYNESDESVTWETCALREWCNSVFYYNAFNELERDVIETTLISNNDNSEFGTSGGNDTHDNVFLLSVEEAYKYFPADEQEKRENRYYNINKYRAVSPTKNAHVRITIDNCCRYWLRTSGYKQNCAATVDWEGEVSMGGWNVDERYAIRPAIWVDISRISTEISISVPTATSTPTPAPTAISTPTPRPTPTNTPTPVATTSLEDFTWTENEDGTLTVKFKNKNATSVVVPRQIEGKTVTAIGNNAFDACKNLINVEIPDSVTHIGNWAFYRCTNLKSIGLPESIVSIGDSAFVDCSSLVDIEIPDSVINIGFQAFVDCSSLTSVKIPEGVTCIEAKVFFGCEKLTSIEIPNSVTSIGDYAFEECSNLTSIEIPDSVTSIGEGAFNDCSNLTNIKIPYGSTSIDNAFAGCSNLVNIEIPDSMTSIGYSAFDRCSKLTSIEIPDNVTYIGSYAFDGCTNLVSIEMPDSVTNIGDGAFRDCIGLTSIEISKGVTNIGFLVFDGCIGLTSIEIPGSVISIGDLAFYSCANLVKIQIPNSVSSIANSAFANCSSLTTIYTTSGSYAEQWALDNGYQVEYIP